MGITALEGFANIRGGFTGECKDVYFIRAVGVSKSLAADVKNMDRVLTQRGQAGNGKYYRMEELPRFLDAEESALYARYYEEWIESGRKSVSVKAADGNEALQEILGNVLGRVMEMFQKQSPGTSASIEKNFGVKLLYWFDRIWKELKAEWNPRTSMKFVLSNVTKKQEYFFCYFLTLIGIDVLLLQYREDIGDELKRLNLSKEIALGSFGNEKIPSYEASAYKKQGPSKQKTPESGVRNKVKIPPRQVQRQRQEQGTVQAAANIPPGNMPSKRPAVSIQRRESERTERNFEELALLASSVVMIAIHDKRGEVIGSGSGIMIGRDGYILTNHHVASEGSFYSVRIEDEEEIYQTDELVKYNPVLDLAVIRIDRVLNPLSVYRGGKKLVRGQKVVAIGSPLGLFNSVSDGIISGFRSIENVDMIQFTAPTSRGSSGGAVLNMYGEVIGISTAGIDNGQNINLAVGYDYINKFIQGFT